MMIFIMIVVVMVFMFVICFVWGCGRCWMVREIMFWIVFFCSGGSFCSCSCCVLCSYFGFFVFLFFSFGFGFGVFFGFVLFVFFCFGFGMVVCVFFFVCFFFGCVVFCFFVFVCFCGLKCFQMMCYFCIRDVCWMFRRIIIDCFVVCRFIGVWFGYYNVFVFGFYYDVFGVFMVKVLFYVVRMCVVQI